MATLIPVTIVIGDRTYRIRIEPTDEEVVRKSVKSINDTIIDFKTQFSGKDMQDYIAMVLMWFATEQTAGKISDVEKENVASKLNTIEKMLDNQLNSDQYITPN